MEKLTEISNGSYVSPSATDISLMGIWQLANDSGQQIRIGQQPGVAQQLNRKLLIVNLTVSEWAPAAMLLYRDYDGTALRLSPMTDAEYATAKAGLQKPNSPPEITIEDANHITIAPNFRFVRAPQPILENSACSEAKNHKGLSGGEALRKGDTAMAANPPRYAEAACWYFIGSFQGGPRPPAALGAMFLEGKGVPRDPVKAFLWFQQSAYQGYYYAESNLAQMYKAGFGTAKDLEKSAYWSDLAERQNEAQIQAIHQAEAQNSANNAVALFGLMVLGSAMNGDNSQSQSHGSIRLVPYSCGGNSGGAPCFTVEYSF